MTVYPLKCRIRNAGTGVTRVDVYDDIGAGGWFSDGVSAADFAGQLSGLRGALEVHVNSAGGDVFDGLAIMNTIRDHKGPVTTVVDGLAASIASVIVQAGQERIAQPGSMLMIHDAFGQAVGNASEMAKMAQTLDEVSANLASVYAGRSGKTQQAWRDAMKQETWYTAEEAVAAGLADKVGTGTAELPAAMDLAALGTVPGRIAAQLREMPVAVLERPQDAGARHDPMTGTHSHPHPAYGSQGGDALHSHEHTHDGDANHSHSHAEPEGDGAQDAAAGQDCPTCKGTGKIDEGHRQCPDCGGTGKKAAAAALTAEEVLALIRHELQAAAGKPGTHGDHEKWDPDGDGDCDACPEGDTDHDYWTAAGEQLKDVPGKPMEDRAALLAEIRAAVREELAGLATFLGAAVDNSDWDASKAWSAGADSDDPAAFYAGICAGKKAGDKSTQAAWALPYKYTPSSPPNAAGVRNALARLDQTEGLTNKAEAKATLQAAMKKVNPDWEPEDSAGDGPGDETNTDLSGADLEQIRSALRGAFA
jgi:ATP-dependent protease ClpP protease subunit